MTTRVHIVLSDHLVTLVDTRRGLVSRSAYLRDLIEKSIGDPIMDSEYPPEELEYMRKRDAHKVVPATEEPKLEREEVGYRQAWKPGIKITRD